MIVVYFFVFSPAILIAIDCCGRSLSRTSLRSIPSIELVDCCARANFVAVKHFARSRSPSREGSFVRTNIVAVELARSRASSRSIQSFEIIVAIELTRSFDHRRDRTGLSRLSSQWTFARPSSPQNSFVRATLVAVELLVRDHLRDRKKHSRSSSRPNLKARATIVAIELLRSRASSRWMRSFAIIIANKLDRSSDHRRDRTCSLAAILALETFPRDPHRDGT